MTKEPLTGLISTLKKTGLDLTAEEIADILWLAPYLDKPETSGSEAQVKHAAHSAKRSDKEIRTHDKREKTFSEPEIPETKIYHPETEEREIAGPGGVGGLPFRSPGVSALPGQLALGRALRPLNRKVQSRTRMVFDEESTVYQIAECNNWEPQMRPEMSRWLDMILLVDESPSMVIWRETIGELKSVFERQGAFRNVQLWGFHSEEDGTIQLHVGTIHERVNPALRSPQELIDPSGQRLILVVSDCVSSFWHDGRAYEMMKSWAENTVIAIVQMLPYWFWERTGLDSGVSGYFRSLGPGTVNEQLLIEQSELFFIQQAPQGLPVPVITLEHRSLLPWAKHVAGMAGQWIPGVLFHPHDDSHYISGESPQGMTAEECIKLFRATASPLAQQLAGYLAAVPLSLHVMRIVQKVMMPDDESKHVHLAEVLLSGLMVQIIPESATHHPDNIRYEFVEGIQDRLLNSVLISETVDVIDKVTREVKAFIDKNTGRPIDFKAILADPRKLDQIVINEHSQAFATIAAHVLYRLGGNFAKLANYLDSRVNEHIIKKKLCLVLMPVKKELKEVYLKAIKPACEESDWRVFRSDGLDTAVKAHQMIRNFFTSDVIISDLTGHNTTVFYELGIAHAIDNKTIMIKQKTDTLPSYLESFPSIVYEQTEKSLYNLKQEIKKSLQDIEQWHQSPTNPVHAFKPNAFITKSEFEEQIKPKRSELARYQNELARLQKEMAEKEAELAQVQKELKSLFPRQLRSEPIDELSYDEVKKMLKRQDFFDYYENKEGKGLKHEYELIEREGEKIVVDHTTGLIWQHSGSKKNITYRKAQEYIRTLNEKRFAGFNGWKLPTLEESMSLMESKKHGDLYINKIFDHLQRWIWTSDKESSSAPWVVAFDFGNCSLSPVVGYNYVRAVR